MKNLVFISHIVEEKDIAFLVKDFIEDAFLGLIDVFISSDKDSISLGQKWLNSITDSLKNCSIEIILCSPISIKRPWINFEAGAGWIRDIPVIPLCHSGIEPSNLPLPLNLLQAAKANEISEMNMLLPVLAQAIGSKNPSYDFTDFVKKVKNFETQYTFWDQCNKIFQEINKIDNQIIPNLKLNKNIKISLTDFDIRIFESFVPFLKIHKLLDFLKVGGASMGPTGTFYGCNINILPDLQNVMNDNRFKI